MVWSVANSEWKQKALADPNLNETQVRVLMHGPQSLAEAWVLAALRLKFAK